jgi:hypothetical protein
MPSLFIGSYPKTRRSHSNLNAGREHCVSSYVNDPRCQIADRLAREIRPKLQFYAGFIDSV